MSEAKTYLASVIVPITVVFLMLTGFGPLPSIGDVATGDMRGVPSMSGYGNQSFDEVLHKVGCAERFWTADRDELGQTLYVMDMTEQQYRNWGYEAVDRGYLVPGGLFSDGHTTAKLQRYIYSLNRSECVETLTAAGIPRSEIGGDEQ